MLPACPILLYRASTVVPFFTSLSIRYDMPTTFPSVHISTTPPTLLPPVRYNRYFGSLFLLRLPTISTDHFTVVSVTPAYQQHGDYYCLDSRLPIWSTFPLDVTFPLRLNVPLLACSPLIDDGFTTFGLYDLPAALPPAFYVAIR